MENYEVTKQTGQESFLNEEEIGVLEGLQAKTTHLESTYTNVVAEDGSTPLALTQKRTEEFQQEILRKNYS